MAHIVLDREKLKHNYDCLCRLFWKRRIQWAVVSKLLCGNELFLSELIRLGPRPLCDSRLTNLKVVKKIDPTVKTVYIKPPPPGRVAGVVRYADVSFNSEYGTLELLSAEALRQGRIHQVVVMVELGERREGVMPSDVISFCEKASGLPGIRVVGVATNFACLSGILPSRDKLSQLAACGKRIADRFGERLLWVSGGSSVVIPLLASGEVPAEINHFRVGETLFLGTDVYHGGTLEGMYPDVVTVYAEIIELIRKPSVPDGDQGRNVQGRIPEFDSSDREKTSWRAIVDLGLLDIGGARLVPADPLLRCIGASSDMLVVDLGSDPNGYRPGDCVEFRTDYMGILRLMNSPYVRKEVSASGPGRRTGPRA